MRHRLVAVGVLLSVAAWGCGGEEESPPPSVLTGVITQVRPATGSNVTGFDLDAAGESYEILIDPARDYGFDLAHLREHQTTGDPVRVRFRQRGEGLYALRIDDA
jgi:hypothetical protein